MTFEWIKSTSWGLLVMAATATPGVANDSLATLGAGGLELTTSADIVMESEDLFLSPKEVRVRYVFRNVSDQDITARVAFPMPEVPFGPADNVDLPDPEKDNFVDFSVTVEGQTLEPELEQRAISSPVEYDSQKPSPYRAGTDITSAVLKAGLPVNAKLPEWQKAIKALPADKRVQLVKQGVLYPDSLDAHGAVETYGPQWSLRETYHWEQTFPANKPVVVEHRYTPVIGGSFVTGADGDAESIRSEYQERYCIDQAGMAGIQHILAKATPAAKRGEGDPYLYIYKTEYILKTGANWKGKIGHFKLTLDKLHADAILSTCADGIKKTGPTTFEVQRSNFSPNRDISFVIFLTGDL